jgi:hypothetical protein
MAPTTQILCSGALTFGAPLLLALRELVVLRRARDDDGWERTPDPTPVAPKPLPDCLIPKPMPQREQRVRELA